MGDLTHRADCHASGTVGTHARVAIADWEPLNLCRHCLHKHADQLTRLGAIIERLAESDGCDTEVVKA